MGMSYVPGSDLELGTQRWAVREAPVHLALPAVLEVGAPLVGHSIFTGGSKACLQLTDR